MNGKRKSMPFATPKGLEGRKKSHYGVLFLHDKSKSRQNKHHVQYSDVLSVIRPILYGQDLSIPEPDGNMEYSPDSEHCNMTVAVRNDAYNPEESVPFTPAELNDLTHDLKLSKKSAQLLGLRMKEKLPLAPGTKRIKTVFHVPG